MYTFVCGRQGQSLISKILVFSWLVRSTKSNLPANDEDPDDSSDEKEDNIQNLSDPSSKAENIEHLKKRFCLTHVTWKARSRKAPIRKFIKSDIQIPLQLNITCKWLKKWKKIYYLSSTSMIKPTLTWWEGL